MNLAINYSSAAVELFCQGVIHLDYFKVPDWPVLIKSASRLCSPAVHFSLQAGSGSLAHTNWDLIDQLLKTTATPYVNVHLEAHKIDYPGITDDQYDCIHAEQVFENLLSDLRVVVDYYGAERVIAENVPYHGHNDEHLRTSIEPAVISQLIQQTGAGLLLDISHARISAHSLRLTDHAYLSQLPTARICEMHIAGVHPTPDGGLQDHLGMLAEDWSLLEWVLERIRNREWSQPWMLAFEYGGIGSAFSWRTDPTIIAQQVPRLYAMAHSV